MSQNNLLEWLFRVPKRMVMLILGGGALVVILFLAIPAAVAGYVVIGYSQEFVSLLISAFGAMSTLLLVLVTFATFVENQLLNMRQRKRPLIREEIQEVILPSIHILEENKSRLQNGSVDWRHLNVDRSRQYSGFRQSTLEPLVERSGVDSVVFDRFSEKHPQIARDMRRHDELLNQLAKEGRELVDALSGALSEYIVSRNLTYGTVEHPDPELLAVFVIDEQEKLEDTHKYQELWDMHQDQFRMMAEAHLGDDFDEFLQLKQEYQNFAEDTARQLYQIRRELQGTYNISLYDSQTNSDEVDV